MNTGRFPLSVKRATERDWRTGQRENVLSSVHVGKGVCNAVESSGAKSQMESTRASGETRTSGRRVLSDQVASVRTSTILN